MAIGEALRKTEDLLCWDRRWIGNVAHSELPPHLDKVEGIKSWSVNTVNPGRILTVETDGLDARGVKAIVEKAGFKAEALALFTDIFRYQSK